jgi:agmatine deiminase
MNQSIYKTRRQFLRTSLLGALGSTGLSFNSLAKTNQKLTIPDESEKHRCTWMAFAINREVWGLRLSKAAQQNLALIARTISAFEPVTMLVNEEDYELAYALCGNKVTLIEAEVDDLWIRDTGPVSVRQADGSIAGIDFNFNGWGNKQEHAADAKLAAFVCKHANLAYRRSSLVMEGGGLEVDGRGTAIITESCVLNPNRNPGLSKAQCEAELLRVAGIQQVIWLSGLRGHDITDGHTDFYARFAQPNLILAGVESDKSSIEYGVTQTHLKQLSEHRRTLQHHLKILPLANPSFVRPQFDNKDFAAGYINFYVCNGAVIAPQFGDKRADNNARDILRDAFPGREIVQLDIDAIAAGGGGIHCTTQQQA